MTQKFICDCDWMDELPPCGCGEHDVRPYRDESYHYKGQHWRSYCLIEELLKERPQ